MVSENHGPGKKEERENSSLMARARDVMFSFPVMFGGGGFGLRIWGYERGGEASKIRQRGIYHLKQHTWLLRERYFTRGILLRGDLELDAGNRGGKKITANHLRSSTTPFCRNKMKREKTMKRFLPEGEGKMDYPVLSK